MLALWFNTSTRDFRSRAPEWEDALEPGEPCEESFNRIIFLTMSILYSTCKKKPWIWHLWKMSDVLRCLTSCFSHKGNFPTGVRVSSCANSIVYGMKHGSFCSASQTQQGGALKTQLPSDFFRRGEVHSCQGSFTVPGFIITKLFCKCKKYSVWNSCTDQPISYFSLLFQWKILNRH